MPLRDRRYENLLQFIFGGLIWLAILYAVIDVVWEAIRNLMHR